MADATVGIDVACGLGALTAIVVGVVLASRLTPSFARRATATTTYASLILLWPIVFGCVVRFEFLRQLPLLWLSLMWPMILLLINLCHSDQPRERRTHERTNQQIDVNAVTGFCFAVGGMVSSQLGKSALLSVSTIFTTAFLLCLAFVLPTPEVPSHTPFFVVVETVQQSFLQYAIALLIAGIVLNLRMGGRFAERRSNIIDDLLTQPVESLIGTASRGG